MFPETNRRSLNFMACEYGPTAPGASTAGLVRATERVNGLTGGEDGGQGWVSRDRGRHFSLGGWFECENTDWDRPLGIIRPDPQRWERSGRHGGGIRADGRVPIAYYRHTASFTFLFRNVPTQFEG